MSTVLQRRLLLAALLSLLFAAFTIVAVADDTPLPDADVTAPAAPFLGSTATATVEFDNLGGTGYGPHIDVLVPTSGTHGPTAQGDTDGLEFRDATYLGESLDHEVVTLDGDGDVGDPGGEAEHPITEETVTGDVGDELVVVQLPFGSFTPDQPSASVAVDLWVSELATRGDPLEVATRGLFAYGDQAEGADPVASDWESTAFSPDTAFFGMATDFAPAQSTGPNYPREVSVGAVVAPGQTITDVEVTHQLPVNGEFRGLSAPAGATVDHDLSVGDVIDESNRQLTVTFDAVTGAALGEEPADLDDDDIEFDASYTVNLTVPYADADGDPLLDPDAGGAGGLSTSADFAADWTPLDQRDPAEVLAGVGSGGIDYYSMDAGGFIEPETTPLRPGVTTELRAVGYASDFFAYENLAFEAQMSDGWAVDELTPPEVRVETRGVTISADAEPGEWGVLDDDEGFIDDPDEFVDEGATNVYVDLAEVMDRMGADVFAGACVDEPPLAGGEPDPGCTDGPESVVEVVFETAIDDEFTGDIPDEARPEVVQGDGLFFTPAFEGDVVDLATADPTGERDTGAGSRDVSIEDAEVSYDVVAVDGETVDPADGPPVTTPGSEVTYRLQVHNPIGRAENVELSALLPLPVIDATEVAEGPLDQAALPPGELPDAGQLRWGPNQDTDDFEQTPELSVDEVNNALRVDVGDVIDADAEEVPLDLLFTVTTTNQRYEDGLLLSSYGEVAASNTGGEAITDEAITQIERTEPRLEVNKSVIAVESHRGDVDGDPGPDPTGPGADGFRFGDVIDDDEYDGLDADAEDLEAGDVVSFVVAVRNYGSSPDGAWGVELSDTLPEFLTGEDDPTLLNFSVTDGTGDPIDYEPVDPGDDPPGFFHGGLRLLDHTDADGTPIAPAIPGPDDDTPGENIAVITYDLLVDDDVPPDITEENDATVDDYGGSGDEDSGYSDDEGDTADADVANVEATTMVRATSADDETGSASATVGEVVRYRSVVEVPQGVIEDAELAIDLHDELQYLDDGTLALALVSDDGLASTAHSAAAEVAGGGDSPDDLDGLEPDYQPDAATVTADGGPGGDVDIDLGTVTNSDRDDDREFVVADYNVLLVNDGDTDDGDEVGVRTAMRGVDPDDEDSSRELDESSRVTVDVVLPDVDLDKTADVDGPVEAGDTVTFEVSVDADGLDAFDVAVDAYPPADLLDFDPDSVDLPAGWDADVTADGLTATTERLSSGDAATIAYDAVALLPIEADETVTNDAEAVWRSLPDDGDIDQGGTGSTTPGGPGEGTGVRTGDDGEDGEVNDLATSDDTTIDVATATMAARVVDAAYGTVEQGEPYDAPVGDLVRVRARVELPRATMTDAGLLVATPDHLDVVDDDTVAVAVLADDDAVTSTELPGDAFVDKAGQDPETFTPTFALADGYDVDDGDLAIDLGSVENDGDGDDREHLIVEATARVPNTADVTAGGHAPMAAAVGSAAGLLDDDETEPVAVVEPDVGLDVTIDDGSVDAGTETTVTASMTSTGTAAAYQPTWTVDLSDDGWAPVSDDDVTVDGDAAGLTHQVVDGDTIEVTADHAAADDDVTVDVTVTVADDVAPTQTLPVQTTAEWTSLPAGDLTLTHGAGESTTADADRGDPDGARDGSDNGDLPNHYTASGGDDTSVDDAAFTLELTDTQFDRSGDDGVVPGEAATFAAEVTVPRSSVGETTFTAPMPDGFDYQDGSYELHTSEFDGTVTVGDVDEDADELAVTFDEIVANPDPATDPQTFTVEFATDTLDDTAVTPDGTATQTGALTGDLDGDDTADVATHRVDLHLENPDAPDEVTAGTDGFDPVDYPVRVTNEGSVTATGVQITTTVPDHTSVDETAATDAGWTVDGDTVELADVTLDADDDTQVDLPLLIDDPLAAGATGTDLDFATADDGTSGSDYGEYDTSSAPHLGLDTGPDLAVTITGATDTVEPGDAADHTVTWGNDGSQDTAGVEVTVTTPDELTVDTTAAAAHGWTCDDAHTCTRDVGDLPGRDDPQGSAVLPTNVADTLPAGVDDATAEATIDDDGGSGGDLDADRNTDTHDTPLGGEPVLQLTVTSPDTPQRPGETFHVDLVVANTGDRDATGVEVDVDTTAGLQPLDGCDDPDCTVDIGDLPAGGDASAQLDATVATPAAVDLHQVEFHGLAATDGANTPDGEPATDTDEAATPVEAAPDLVVTAAGPGDTQTGEGAEFTVAVENQGDRDTTGVQLQTTVPAHTTAGQAADDQGWECDGSDPGDECRYDLGDLGGDGGSVDVPITVDVDATLPAGVDETTLDATVDDDLAADDPNPAGRSDTAIAPLLASPVLDLDVTADPGEVQPGGQVVFTLDYGNSGAQDATGVTLTADVPAGATADLGASTAGWACDDGCDLDVGELGVDDVGSATLVVTVDDPYPGDDLTVDGEVADDGDNSPDGQPVTAYDDDTADVVPLADLGVLIDADPDSVGAGETAEFPVAVDNLGPNAAEDVSVTVDLGGEFTWSETTGGWSCADQGGGEVSCELGGAIDAGDSAEFTVEATAPPQGTQVTVPAVGDSPTEDPDPDRRDDDTTVTVEPRADIGVSVDVTPDDHWPVGETATIDVDAYNVGPSDSVGTSGSPVVLDMPLPEGVTVGQVDAGGDWDCSTDDDGVVCEHTGTVAPGDEFAQVRVDVDVEAGAPDEVEVTAELSPGEVDDPYLGNNTDTFTRDVTPRADLALDKHPDGPFAVGEVGSYELALTNRGPSPAQDVTISDDLDEGLELHGATSDDDWECEADASGRDVVCALDGDLAAGETTVVELLVDVTADAAPEVTNTAEAASSVDDPTPEDATSTAGPVTVVPVADLAVSLDDDGPAEPGETVTWTAQVDNHGPSSSGAPVPLTLRLPHDVGLEVSAGGQWDCDVDGDQVSCAHEELAAGESASGVVEVTVDAREDDTPALDAEAEVGVPVGVVDPYLANNVDYSTAEVALVADLAVTVGVDDAAPQVGDTGEVTVDVANHGPNDHPGPVQVGVALPDDAEVLDQPDSGTLDCDVGGGQVTCVEDGEFADGRTEQVRIPLEYLAHGAAQVTTEVNPDDDLDPDLSNNTDQATVDVAAVSDLTIDKDAPSQAQQGQEVVWEMTVTNHGPSPVDGEVLISDTLPDGVEVDGGVDSTGALDCDVDGGHLECVHDDGWPVGEEKTVTVPTQVGDDVEGEVTNVAEVLFPGGEASDEHTLTVVPPPAPEPVVLDGVVVDADTSAPVPGASVSLRRDGDEVAARDADGEGAFDFGEVDDGQYVVAAAADGFEDGETSVAVDGDDESVVVELPREPEPEPVVLDGVVVDADTSAPVPGASVSLRRDGDEVAARDADGEGAFDFGEVDDGQYVVAAAADGFEDGETSVTVDGDDESVVVELPREPEPEDTIRLDGVVVIEGTGARVPEATVRLYRDETQVDTTVADGEGAFDFGEVEAGQYRVTAEHPEYTDGEVTVEVLEEDTTTQVPVRAPEDDDGLDEGDDEELAETGAPLASLAAVGLALLLLGTAAVLRTSRRRRDGDR